MIFARGMQCSLYFFEFDDGSIQQFIFWATGMPGCEIFELELIEIVFPIGPQG